MQENNTNNKNGMNFYNYLCAGYPLLWVETFEEARAIKNLMQQAEGYNCFQWDIVKGFTSCNNENNGLADSGIDNPIDALNHIKKLDNDTVIFMYDFHKFMDDLIITRTIKTLSPLLQSMQKTIVFISPVTNIPIELEKDITCIDFGLPTIENLVELAGKIANENGIKIEVSETVISASRGLTMSEASNAFSRSLVTTKSYNREILESEKLQTVKKSGLMEIYKSVPLDSVGGLKKLKSYVMNRKQGFNNEDLPTPKGVLLTGLPGSGKSLTAKAISSALEMPLIRLDLGTLKGSLVGESERNMKNACNMIDAISPCVVWLDEIEKSLSGVQSSGKTDGGTGSNMFGQLLTWMEESKAQKYIVATCNDIDDLLALSQGALIRRFDDIFFVDMPNFEERKEIISIMASKYNVIFSDAEIENLVKLSNQWTGAEIEKAVKNSLYDGIEKAVRNIRPISIQNKSTIDKAREWANNNAIIANGEDKDKDKDKDNNINNENLANNGKRSLKI